MSDAFLQLGGVRARSVDLLIPWSGMAAAEVAFDVPMSLPTGPTTLSVGALSLVGRVDPGRSGEYALATFASFVGGALGWRSVVKPRHYHSDGGSGVRRSTVISTTAAEVGETVVVAPEVDGYVGADFVREAGPASRVLAQVFPDVPWYVDELGVTRVGARATRDVTGKVEILDVDVTENTCTLAADDPRDMLPGCSFTDSRLPAGFLIHDVAIKVEGSRARATAWSGKGNDDALRGVLKTLVRESVPRLTFACPYRYRVVEMLVDRASLQAVAKAPGLPDALPVKLAPGLSGAWAQLRPGSIVLVQFVEMDPGQPIITHYATKDDGAFLPIQAALDASHDVRIGESADRVHVGGEEPADLFTSAKRFVRWGDVAIGPAAVGVPYTLAPASGTMAKAGST